MLKLISVWNLETSILQIIQKLDIPLISCAFHFREKNCPSIFQVEKEGSRILSWLLSEFLNVVRLVHKTLIGRS